MSAQPGPAGLGHLARLEGPRDLARALAGLGARAWLVGGVVRDALLGRPLKDVDLLVAGLDPAGLTAAGPALAARLGATLVPLDPGRGILRLVLPAGDHLDLACAVGGGLEEDLRRRDLTVNAMAWDPEEGVLLDPTGGLADLQAGLLRLAHPRSLHEDPLRCLRAVRFLCQLSGFRLAPGLAVQLAAGASGLARVSGERIRDELFLSLACPGAGCARRLQEAGLLFAVFPELEASAGCGQNHYHHLDVLEHTLEVFAVLERLEVEGWARPGPDPEALSRWWAEPTAGGRRRGALLKLAALLHDVAKPATRTVEPGGRVRFLGHEAAGAPVAARIGARLRLSGREIRRLEAIVRLHLRPVLLGAQEASPKARFRFFRDAGEAALDLLVLSLADVEATRGPAQPEARIEGHRRFVAGMVAELLGQGRLSHPRPPLDGEELMRLCALPPGPEVGAWLARLTEAVALGEVGDRAEALDWLARRGISRAPREGPARDRSKA